MFTFTSMSQNFYIDFFTINFWHLFLCQTVFTFTSMTDSIHIYFYAISHIYFYVSQLSQWLLCQMLIQPLLCQAVFTFISTQTVFTLTFISAFTSTSIPDVSSTPSNPQFSHLLLSQTVFKFTSMADSFHIGFSASFHTDHSTRHLLHWSNNYLGQQELIVH